MARKILLADDSVTAQNMGRKILADAGYEVTTVNNGSAALKRIGEHRPDLIVLDVYMPGYSGLEVCQRLKETGDTSRIPILLTVGKLEPFKPEEAKRVRADAYIVKPFEASELLSALSKLEDKIVPRAESKPGRLARTAAALDEVPRDKTVSGEEDSGWKNRIAFPSKKKEKEEAVEAVADESAIYNPVNKDLRTVIEPRPAAEARPSEAKPEESKVDLGALAPEGLPKDVTAEEIAALASAAAQIQGKGPEGKAEEAPEAKVEAAKIEAGKLEPVKVEPAAAEVSSAPGSPVAEAVTAAAAPIEDVSAKSPVPDAVKESAPVSAPVEPVAAVSEAKPKSEDMAPAKASREAEREDVPVTMAVAAGAASGGPRWAAVAVALAPEDSGISLEEEMRRAAAVYAAPAQETDVAEVSAPVAAAVEAVAPVPEPAAPQAPAPVAAEPAQPVVEAPAVAADAVRATVKEFETVAAAYVPEAEAAQSYSSAQAASPSPVETPASEPVPPVDQPVASASAPAPETARIDEPPHQPAPENFKTDETEARVAEAPGMAEVATPVVQAAEPVPVAEATPESAEASPRTRKEKETEPENDHLAASTAAAWASWRRVREDAPAADSSDSAAMAAAAGAEKSPEETSGNGSDPAIASIVDSVLADLRPRIVEEISRKLGKKS